MRNLAVIGVGYVALVTGTTSGLGRRFALVLAKAGADVVVTGRREERLAEHLAPLAAELDRWCREQISAVTCPRSYLFVDDLPRLRARLGDGRVGGMAGAALTGLLQGRRDDASISKLFTCSITASFSPWRWSRGCSDTWIRCSSGSWPRSASACSPSSASTTSSGCRGAS